MSFDSQGGSPPSPASKPVTVGQQYGELATTTRTDYIFAGWWTGENGTGTRVESTTEVTIDSNQTLYAKWTPQFTVFFDGQGGIDLNPAKKVVTFGQQYGPLATTTRDGFTFAGWWTGENGSGTQVESTTEVTILSDQTLYANWLPRYTVTFDSQGGTSPSPASKVVTYNQEYGPLATTTREGYSFDGWWTEQNGTGTRVESTTKVSIDSHHTLYANWKANEYTVSFDSQGGTDPSPANKEVTYKQKYGELATTTRDGYTFADWWTAPNGGGTQVESTTEVTILSDQTLYANWTANDYTVSFDGQGGTTPNPESKVVTYNREYGELATTTRDGFTFAGWWTGENGSGTQVESTTEVTILSDQTLYAKWLPRYTVTFDSQGGTSPSLESKVVTYNREYGELAT